MTTVESRLIVDRDDRGQATALSGRGVAHQRRDDDRGWTHIDDPLGTTSVRQDEQGTQILRDGHLLSRRAAGSDVEEWILPGTSDPVRLARDGAGDVVSVRLGDRVIARRTDVDGRRVLRWASGDAGVGAFNGGGQGLTLGSREWEASSAAGELTLGRDRYRFDACGRVVEHNHPEFGCTRYEFAGRLLIGVQTPTDTIELHHGADGRIRSRRDAFGRTTYGYDEAGRRVREVGPTGVRRLSWDDLDRLVGVRTDGHDVRFAYDGFGRRVSRSTEAGVRFEHRDLQGRLWAITDDRGRPLRTWLWDRHLCLAAFDGPVSDGPPAAVYATAPSGVPVGFLDASGAVHDLPATPYGEDRPPGHPALSFHFADELTGYVHLTQRDVDPRTWQFLTADPYRDDGDDRRRSLLGLDGPLSTERDPRTNAYAICGFDPVRRVDPNGAVSAGTVLWQLFGGLTWHLPAHIINWLWIHPVVNFSFATVLAWLPAAGFDPRGAYDSWYEFWDPGNYSGESSDRQDIASMLMAGWMSANRTFTFQNAIWGRRKEWDSLDLAASLEPSTPFSQQRFGSLFRITRGDQRNADVVDGWTFVANGIDTQAAATRLFSVAGGRESVPVFGDGRERLITQGNLHISRNIQSIGVNLPGTDPNAPTQGPIALHSRATAVQECPPGRACAQVTMRTAGQIFTFTGADGTDGDVVRLGGALTLVTAVQGRGSTTDLSVRAGHPSQPLPAPGGYTAQWATPDPAPAQVLGAHPGGPDRLQLPDAAVGWTPGSIARINIANLNAAGLATVDRVESYLPVLAQAALPQGADVLPLGAAVPVVGARLEADQRLRVPNGAVANGVVLQLTRGGDSRLARVTLVGDDPATGEDLLTLDATPVALGLPGAGDPAVAVLTAQAPRGTLDVAVPAGAATAVALLGVNSVLGANIVGFDVGGALAVLTGAETRAIHVAPSNPATAPWSVDRFTFPAGARSHPGQLSGPLELVQFDAGDAAASIPADALLRLRTFNLAAVPNVGGLTRVSDSQLDRAGPDTTLNAGDLVAVAGAATGVVSVADIALSVTIDRDVGVAGNPVERVCRLVPGERTYNAIRVVGPDGILLTTTPPGAAGPAPTNVLFPDWVAGDIVRITVAANPPQEWVLAADLNGGRLLLRDGPGPAPGAVLPAPLAGAANDAATVQRLVPTWPPLAMAATEAGRTSTVVAPTQHRWVTQTSNLAVGTAVGIQVGGRTFVARIRNVTAVSMRTSPLPAGPITGYTRCTGTGVNDRIVARWRLLGDEIQTLDQTAPTPTAPAPPAGAVTVTVLDALAPLPAAAVTLRAPALMCPAEPENDQWIFTAREALREHELRHTVQASMWGPLFLGLPLGLVGDVLWDLRDGQGKFEASPYETVEPLGEDEDAKPPRPAGFKRTAPVGGFLFDVGSVVEFDAGGKAWRTVITAIDKSQNPALFWVQNLPPDGLLDGALRARTLHHTDPTGELWMKILQVFGLVSNAHLMEFTTGLIFEGLIGMFWRIGRLFDFARTDSVDIAVTDDPNRLHLHAADAAALAKLRLAAGSDVLIDSTTAADDSYRTVVTEINGQDLTVRDPVPKYQTNSRIRLWRGQAKTPDTFWDLRSYTAAALVAGTKNVISLTGANPPALRAMDLLKVKWIDPDGRQRSQNIRVAVVAGAAPPTYQLGNEIDLRHADPDTLQVSRLYNEDDTALNWIDTAFYETPIRIRRVTKYLFDPWRALTRDAEFVRPADGSTFKTVLAWITRGLRYAVSNYTWTPIFGYVWWSSVCQAGYLSELEQSASWNSGDLYTTLTRSGDPRFAASEGGHGNEPGDYRIFEGELLRMWTWEQWRWNDVFTSWEIGGGVGVWTPPPALQRAPATQNPVLISAANPNRLTPWDDRWRFTAPAVLPATGLEYPAEFAQQTAAGVFQPSPLLQIPTRRDVCRNSGVYFAACQAGAWQVGVSAPSGRDQQTLSDGEQYHTRTVQVRALTVTAGTTALPWQPPAAPAALTLFLTQEQRIDVTGGNGGTYRLRLIDPAGGLALYRPGDLALRARLTPNAVEAVEVVRVYEPSDPYFGQFGTYVSKPLIIPVRRFQVSVTDAITLRNGTDPASPDVAGVPVLPGDIVSAFLPVVTSVAPTVAFRAAPPAVAPPLPTVSGPLPAGALNRYQFAVSAEATDAPVTVDATFTFADPLAPATTHPVRVSFVITPAAALTGPDTVAPNAAVTLTVNPSDGSPLVPADVTVPAGNASPAAGITVTTNAAGQVVVAAAAAAVAGTAFVVRVQWQGRGVARAMRVG